MKPITRKNLNEEVYGKISEMIMDGQIIPGELIDRRNLAERLGVSQTPVNEIINRLHGEGMFIRDHGKGFYLREYSLKDQADFFAARAGIESMAIRLCMEILDEKERKQLGSYFDGFAPPFNPASTSAYRHQDHVFHEQLLLQSGNAVFRDFNRSYSFIVKCYMQGLLRPPEETLPEHHAITSAIIKGDTEKAARGIMEHHLATRAALLERVGN